MYYVTIYYANGDFDIQGPSETNPPLDVLQKIVGGYIEAVPHFDRYGDRECVAFCNEEGKLNHMPMNARATYLWYACLAPQPFVPDALHGDVVIVAYDTDAEREAL